MSNAIGHILHYAAFAWCVAVGFLCGLSWAVFTDRAPICRHCREPLRVGAGGVIWCPRCGRQWVEK